MNIFFLDRDPELAAQYHCDVHVRKMIIESAQLLSTAHRVLDGRQTVKLSSDGKRLKEWVLPDWREPILYKSTHYNHPCAIWARTTSSNYDWLYLLFTYLCVEFTKRYGKVHMSQLRLEEELCIRPSGIPLGPFVDPPQAMDSYPQCKVPGDTVQAYRNYYKEIKSDLASWSFTDKPYWY